MISEIFKSSGVIVQWLHRLWSLARLGSLNLQTLDESALAEVFFPRLLPAHWHKQAFVARGSADGGPQTEWFSLLWRKLKVQILVRPTQHGLADTMLSFALSFQITAIGPYMLCI